MRLYHSKYPISESTEYVIDYIYDSCSSTQYYQLVRVKDDAILLSSEFLTDLMLACWYRDIPKSKVSII